jgi:PST family polysaccharide transporter
MNFGAGLLLAGMTSLAAPFLADFFRTQELTPVLRVLSLCFVFRGLTVVPTALLTRNMQFRGLGILEISGTFVSGVCAVAAAMFGAGYWALVIQALVFELTYLVLILPVLARIKFAWSKMAAHRLWSFSSRVMGADLVNFVSNNSDKFLVARFLGATPLGIYSLAFRVLQLTLAMSTHAGRVILPTFARLQDDREQLGRAFLGLTEVVSLTIFPAMTLIILAAPIGVPAVFGDQWIDAIVPVQLVAAMTMPYMLHSNMGPLFVAVGRADWEFRWSVGNAIVALVAYSIGIRWGIVGLATSYLIMMNVLHVARFMVTQRLIPITVRTYVRVLAPAASCTVVLCIVWLGFALALQSVASGMVAIIAASIAGSLAYVLALRFGWPSDFRRQVDFALLVVRGGRS